MKAVNVIKTAVWIALLAGVSAADMKNVAVVETEIDAQSGASAQMNPADVRLVTAELRREAVKNLPRDKYNIMTTETVYAQGGAVVEECAEENCVITLGSKIGADYIVRGIISKVETRFALSVEVYETENGNLVASSEPVRSESIGELLEKTAAACAEMYQSFANPRSHTQTPETNQSATYIVTIDINPINGGRVIRNPSKIYYNAGEYLGLYAEENNDYTFTGWSGMAEGSGRALAITVDGHTTLTANFRKKGDPPQSAFPRYEPRPEPPPKPKKTVSLGAGGFYANDFGGGLTWSNGERVIIPYSGGGAYIFFDIQYAEILAGYSGGSSKWKSPDATISGDAPEWKLRYMNISLFAKYPMGEENGKFFPLIGVDYEEAQGGKDFNALWLKLGFGFDFDMGGDSYWRFEFLYGRRGETEIERVLRNMESNYSAYDVKTRPGHGITFNTGIGVKF